MSRPGRTPLLRPRLIGAAIGLGAFASPLAVLAAGDEIGLVLATRGDVTVERDETREPLNRRDSIQVGDTITTGSNSRAQLRLDDDQTLSLDAETRLSFEAYEFDPESQEGESRKSLLEGGLRAVSGAISGEDDYSIETPVAVIGVRGTTSDIVHDEQFGTVGGTPQGRGWAENLGADPQRAEVGDDQPDDYYRIPDADTAPETLPERPTELARIDATDDGEDEDDTDDPAEDEDEEDAPEEDTEEETEPADDEEREPETEPAPSDETSAESEDLSDEVSDRAARTRDRSERDAEYAGGIVALTNDDRPKARLIPATVDRNEEGELTYTFSLNDGEREFSPDDLSAELLGQGESDESDAASWGFWRPPEDDSFRNELVGWIHGLRTDPAEDFLPAIEQRLSSDTTIDFVAEDGALTATTDYLFNADGAYGLGQYENETLLAVSLHSAEPGIGGDAEFLAERSSDDDALHELWSANFGEFEFATEDAPTVTLHTVSGQYALLCEDCGSMEDGGYRSDNLNGELQLQLFGSPEEVTAGSNLWLETEDLPESQDGASPDIAGPRLHGSLYLIESEQPDLEPDERFLRPGDGEMPSDELPEDYEPIDAEIKGDVQALTTWPFPISVDESEPFFSSMPRGARIEEGTGPDDPNFIFGYPLEDRDLIRDRLERSERDDLLAAGDDGTTYWGAWGREEDGRLVHSQAFFEEEYQHVDLPFFWVHGEQFEGGYQQFLDELDESVTFAVSDGIAASSLGGKDDLLEGDALGEAIADLRLEADTTDEMAKVATLGFTQKLSDTYVVDDTITKEWDVPLYSSGNLDNGTFGVDDFHLDAERGLLHLAGTNFEEGLTLTVEEEAVALPARANMSIALFGDADALQDTSAGATFTLQSRESDFVGNDPIEWTGALEELEAIYSEEGFESRGVLYLEQE